MNYRITGLSPDPYLPLFALSDAELEAQGARRMVAETKPGAPCRVTLEDADPGETLILINHVSHDVDNPYRASHAIFVREVAREAATYIDEIPPVLQPRVLSLRGFDKDGMMQSAQLAQPGEAEAAIVALFAEPGIAYIHAHNATRGCFAARIDRS